MSVNMRFTWRCIEHFSFFEVYVYARYICSHTHTYIFLMEHMHKGIHTYRHACILRYAHTYLMHLYTELLRSCWLVRWHFQSISLLRMTLKTLRTGLGQY